MASKSVKVFNKERKFNKTRIRMYVAKNYYFSALEMMANFSVIKLMLRYLGILLLLFVCEIETFSQQAPVFTHHTYTHTFTNPGFAGLGEGICLNSVVRQQWAGFKDSEGNKVAPETFLITGDMPLKFLHGGVGLTIVQDKLGFEKNVGVQIGYAYHKELGSATLGIGTALNFLNRTVDFSKFKPHQSGDPLLSTAEESDMLFDLNLGVFLEVKDSWYAGFSATSLLESKGKALTDNSSSSFVGDRTLYLVGGYHLTAPWNQAIEFQPSISVMSNISTFQMNLTGTVIYNNKFWGGVNYRPQESIGLMIGLSVLDLRIGYAYDINTMGLGVPGSHEISLGYCFKINTEKNIKTYRNTRYL